jgi:outer membrane protein OmpA-like peptidoglycan-associated protein
LIFGRNSPNIIQITEYALSTSLEEKATMSMRKYALMSVMTLTLLTTACTSPGKKTAIGAGAGAVAGGLLGAVIGHQTGNRAGGALIGAAAGGLLGGTVGNRLDKQAKELEKVAETKRTEQGILTKLKSDILFDTGKDQLKPAANTNISEMANILKKYPENVLTVKGYTDSTGSDAVNQPLSQRRADAVKNQLVASGVPGQTVTSMGMGSTNPIGDNKTATGRSTNRRVEVEITVDESKVPKQ